MLIPPPAGAPRTLGTGPETLQHSGSDPSQCSLVGTYYQVERGSEYEWKELFHNQCNLLFFVGLPAPNALLLFLLFGKLLLFPCSSVDKASTYSAGDPGSISGSGRSPGEGNGNPLHYSCLENTMDRGALQATVHGVLRVGHELATKAPNSFTCQSPSLSAPSLFQETRNHSQLIVRHGVGPRHMSLADGSSRLLGAQEGPGGEFILKYNLLGLCPVGCGMGLAHSWGSAGFGASRQQSLQQAQESCWS